MRGSFYHKMLRVSALTTALMLVFVSGILSPLTKQLSDDSIVYLAETIGVFAAVERTELSELTAELTLRERTLAEREAALREREIKARDYGVGTPDYATYILSSILFILTVLIVLNYFFDFIRARKTYVEQTS